MSEQFPEVVAAADLSPLSPSPLHTSPPAVIPSLQNHADSLDVTALNSLAAAKPVAAMAANPGPHAAADPPTKMTDVAVVDGNPSDEAAQVESVADDDSFDAYGEDGDGQEQKSPQSAAGNDDYARTFDSPARPQHDELESEQQAEEVDIDVDPQPDVSMASESMNSSPAPDTLTNQSPAASASAAPSSAPAPAPVSTSHSSPPQELHEHSASSVQNHTVPPGNPTEQSTLPSAVSTTENAPQPSDPIASVDVAPQSPGAAGESAPASVGEDDDPAAVDIQKLVDDITARATASSTSVPAQPGSPPPTAQITPSLPPSLNASQPTSLPPRPSVAHQSGQPISRPEDYHPFQLQPSNAQVPPAPGMPGPPTTTQAAAPGTYMTTGAPGTNGDGIPSLPPPPSASFNAPQSFAAPGTHSLPTSPTVGIPPGDNHHFQAQQSWELYQADEKRYLTEAKWERFPEGSRIFIGGS